MNCSVKTSGTPASILTKLLGLIFLLIPLATPAASFNVACDVSSLVNALQTANSNAEADILNLPSDCTYNFTTFSSSDSDGPNALPILSTEMQIFGNGSTWQRDSSSSAFRIVKVSTQGEVTLYDLTISGGRTSDATALATANAGGGVYNDGDLEIYRSRIAMNSTGSGLVGGSAPFNQGGHGGGIYSSNKLAIFDTNIEQNRTGNSGVNGSEFAGSGAGIYLARVQFNIASIKRSAVFANDVGGSPLDPDSPAGIAGGLYVGLEARAEIENSTFFANESSAIRGGAIYAAGETIINHSTLALNSSGILVGDRQFELINSILSFNDGPDCLVNISPNSVTLVNNIVEDTEVQACDTSNGVDANITGDNANLTLAAFRGGPTPTFGLGPNSKAINKGTVGDIVELDQRSIRRPQPTSQSDLAADVGAYEQEALITGFDSLLSLEIFSATMDQYIEVNLNAGDQMQFNMGFTHANGDLDVVLYRKEDLTTPLAGSATSSDGELFEYTATETGLHWVRVFGFQGATNIYGYSINYKRNELPCFPVKAANKIALICV